MLSRWVSTVFTQVEPLGDRALLVSRQSEAFMLIRSFARLAEDDDFPVAQLSLADRLSITQPEVCCVISNLSEPKAIKKTMDACE